MFDTMQVARRIRDARISQNMTQMNLADAMEVSYQAVSNWERGNSMPDIAKLEQLCKVLGIGIENLLGTGSASHAIAKVIEGSSSAVTKTIYKDNLASSTPDMKSDANGISGTAPITVEEICDIAPLLPPNDIETLVENNLQPRTEKIDFSSITALAPFLDTEYLDNLVQSAHIKSIGEITCIAPFLSTRTLDSLVMNSDPECDMSGITALAPFLSNETLDSLAFEKLHGGSLVKLAGLAPFLSNETLDALIDRADPECDMPGITALAPFLSNETLDRLVNKLIANGMPSTRLSGLFPFLSQDTLQNITESFIHPAFRK